MIKEGAVVLDIEPPAVLSRSAEVFYNPEMAFDRDLSVGVVAAFGRRLGRPINVCDPLAGSGVRGLRYLLEVPTVERAVLNDINPKAFEAIRRNVELNGLSGSCEVYREDANILLHRLRGRFEVVDIDPFGSFVPFLDGALRALREGGLLGLVATDLGLPCGAYPRACYRLYGVRPMRLGYGHEVALRIYIAAVVRRAAQWDKAFSPLFSFVDGHHARLFGRVESGARKADLALSELGFLSHCFQCEFRVLGKEPIGSCPYCGAETKSVGPLWVGRLSDPEFALEAGEELDSRGYEEAARLARRLSIEAKIYTPGYHTHDLARAWGLKPPPLKPLIRSLRERGYNALRAHWDPYIVKTDAPFEVLREVVSSVTEPAPKASDDQDPCQRGAP